MGAQQREGSTTRDNLTGSISFETSPFLPAEYQQHRCAAPKPDLTVDDLLRSHIRASRLQNRIRIPLLTSTIYDRQLRQIDHHLPKPSLTSFAPPLI